MIACRAYGDHFTSSNRSTIVGILFFIFLLISSQNFWH